MSSYEEWSYDFSGRTRSIGDKKVKMEQQLTETLFRETGQRHAIVLGHFVDTKQPVMLKIMVQLNPKTYGIDDVKKLNEVTEHRYCGELAVFTFLEQKGWGPKVIEYWTQTQGRDMPYPGGDIDFIITERVPGEILGTIYKNLDDSQLRSIRTQLTHILENLRQLEVSLCAQHPDFLTYDSDSDTLYLFDLTFINDISGSHTAPITEDDAWVLSFNIWPENILAEDVARPPSLELPSSVKGKGRQESPAAAQQHLPRSYASVVRFGGNADEHLVLSPQHSGLQDPGQPNPLARSLPSRGQQPSARGSSSRGGSHQKISTDERDED